MHNSSFAEIWVEGKDGQSMCALINGSNGWLMYLRRPDDPGFSSRNPNYIGPANAEIEYELSNGQRDNYPASWAVPVEEIQAALEFFRVNQRPPDFINWHNDSGDGYAINEHA